MCDECEALKRRVKELENALDDAIEFLNEQADCDGDSEGYHPNKAMSLMSSLLFTLHGNPF